MVNQQCVIEREKEREVWGGGERTREREREKEREREHLLSLSPTAGKHQCGEVAWSKRFCLRTFFTVWPWKPRSGGRRRRRGRRKRRRGKTEVWLKKRAEFHPRDYWTFYIWAPVMVISCLIVSRWQEPLCFLDFPGIKVCFQSSVCVSVCVSVWVCVCVNEVCGSRKHVKRTFQSPVEGSLAAVARWVSAGWHCVCLHSFLNI